MSKASVYFTLGRAEGKHNMKALKQELAALPGVFSVSISDSSDRVAVDYDTTGVQSDRIKRQLERMGYEILDSESDNHIM